MRVGRQIDDVARSLQVTLRIVTTPLCTDMSTRTLPPPLRVMPLSPGPSIVCGLYV